MSLIKKECFGKRLSVDTRVLGDVYHLSLKVKNTNENHCTERNWTARCWNVVKDIVYLERSSATMMNITGLCFSVTF